MSFKYLIFFALTASLGRVIAAPLVNGNLAAREPCTGLLCARVLRPNGHPDLARRLASLSTAPPTESTPGLNSSNTSSVDPSSTMPSMSMMSMPSMSMMSMPSMSMMSMNSSMMMSMTVSSTDSNPSPTLSLNQSSVGSFVNATPAANSPGQNGGVTITVTSTVTLAPGSSQSPASSESGLSANPPANTNPASSPPLTASSDPAATPNPSLTESSGSPSSPAPTPTVVDLNNGTPNGSVPSEPGQPAPSPSSASGIIILGA